MSFVVSVIPVALGLLVPSGGLPTELTWQDAVRLALKHELSIVQQRHELALLQSRLVVAEDAFGLRLETRWSADVGWRRPAPLTSDGVDHGPDLEASDRTTVGLGLTKQLRWGGRLSLRSDHSRRRDEGYLPEVFTTRRDALELEVPLLGGRGRRVATQELVAANHDLLTGLRRLARSEMRLAVEVVELFHRTRGSEALVEVAIRARERARLRLDLARARLEEGLVTSIDVQRAERDLRERDDDRIRADELLQAERDRLALLLGVPVAARFVLIAPEPFARLPARRHGPTNLAEAERWALGARLDLLVERDQLRLARRDVEVARSQSRPRLDLRLTLSRDQISGAELELGDDGARGAGLVFRHVVGDRTDDEELHRSLIAAEQQRVRVVQVERQVQLEVRGDWRRRSVLERRLDLLEQNRRLASDALGLAEAQHAEDLISLVDLLSDQDDLVEAERRLVTARADLASARARLQLSLGRVVDFQAPGSSYFRTGRDAPSLASRPPERESFAKVLE
ncbi:MAG: TolC family protein [Acidobacteriota bacterium]